MIVNVPFDRQRAWFTDLSGESLSLVGEWPNPTTVPSVGADVRDYAGRRRIIRSARRSEVVAFSLVLVTPVELDQMLAWMGELLLLRTALWRRWGMFTSLPHTLLEDGKPWERTFRLEVAWTDSDFDEVV